MELHERIAQMVDGDGRFPTRRAFADAVGMKQDALSRALSGQRGFATVELVNIAEALGADLHEMITGDPDPYRVVVNARHEYNRDVGAHHVPTLQEDQQVLVNINMAYVQAELPPAQPQLVDPDPAVMRQNLAPGTIRHLAHAVETRFGIDVMRLKELGTAYSGTVAGRTYIAIPAKGTWFRENSDVAHELAHIAGHTSEAAANAFAAEFLLPEAKMREIDWQAASAELVADFLWEYGVSAETLRIRLGKLGLAASPEVLEKLEATTQKVLRDAKNWRVGFQDLITTRMEEAATRRFPLALQEAHELAVEEKRIGPDFLAWMRDISPVWVDETFAPGEPEPDLDAIAADLGLSIA